MREFVFLLVLIGAARVKNDDVIFYYWDSASVEIINDVNHPTQIRTTNETTNGISKRNVNNSLPSHRRFYKTELSLQSHKPDGFETLRDTFLKSKSYTEVNSCTKGPFLYLGCHQCFCIGGQIYVCSLEKCPFVKAPKALMLDVQTCVAGQIIKSSLCSKCICMYGEVFCSVSSCQKSARRAYDAGDSELQCEIGKVISPRGCNQCMCQDEEIYCTIRLCAPIFKTEVRHCWIKKWYTLVAGSGCKNCYCIDGDTSFCYINYCFTKAVMIKGSKNFEQENGPNSENALRSSNDKCIIGSKRYEKCKQCECDWQHKWHCKDDSGKGCQGDPNDIKAFCRHGEYFTITTNEICQGCHCDASTNRWKCFALKGACSTFNNHKVESCTEGDIINNKLSKCSVCYCGLNGMNICTTDEDCAHSIASKKDQTRDCDSVTCVNRCLKKSKNKFGICLKNEGCKCISLIN